MSRPSTLTTDIVLTSLLYLVIISLPHCTATCYYPDGIHVADQDVPCNEGTSDSVCCDPGYACLSNKVCKKINTPNNNSSAEFVRASCTDPKWGPANCPVFCMGNQVGGEGMQKCEDSDVDSYCCLQDTLCTSKCAHGAVVVGFQGEPTALTTISVTATNSQVLSTDKSSTRAGPTSQTATDSMATSSSAVRETPLESRTELKIGVGVGVPIGAIALVLAAYVISRKTKKSKSTRLPLEKDYTYQDKSRDESLHEGTELPAYRMKPLARHELE